MKMSKKRNENKDATIIVRCSSEDKNELNRARTAKGIPDLSKYVHELLFAKHKKRVEREPYNKSVFRMVFKDTKEIKHLILTMIIKNNYDQDGGWRQVVSKLDQIMKRYDDIN